MEYLDINEYQRRINIVRDQANQHPEYLRAISDADRDALSRYFLEPGTRVVEDIAEYRTNLLKQSPMIETEANRAYENFAALAGLPAPE